MKSGNFGWAGIPFGRTCRPEPSASNPAGLAQAVADDLHAGKPVALGFECPLSIPVPVDQSRLGTARDGEGSRPWSAGTGTGVLATGLAQIDWVLRLIRDQLPDSRLYFDWNEFVHARGGLFIWEAFVSAQAKKSSHVGDAEAAGEAFRVALPDPASAPIVTIDEADRPLSLAAAAALWSGWLTDPRALHQSPVITRAMTTD